MEPTVVIFVIAIAIVAVLALNASRRRSPRGRS
jgi:hypothetical protein